MTADLRPEHYTPTDAYEPWKVIDAWDADFYVGNALKYIQRAGRKSGQPAELDWQKVVTYLHAALERTPEGDGRRCNHALPLEYIPLKVAGAWGRDLQLLSSLYDSCRSYNDKRRLCLFTALSRIEAL